jgi:DNA-binding NarL/FixJ family response regulator
MSFVRSKLTVVVADDHVLVADMLKDRIGREAQLEVVAVASDADRALDAVATFRPCVLLTDVDMPGRNPFEAARAARVISPLTAVLFLSSHLHDTYISQAVSAGARGYVLKTKPPKEIIEAICAVGKGGMAFSPEVLERLAIDNHGVRLLPKADGGHGATRLSTLSDRELEVLRYLAEGLAKKQVAEQMHLSVKTIQNHADRLMQKLAIHDRVELARFAIREGITKP